MARGFGSQFSTVRGVTAGCDADVTDGTIAVAAQNRFLPEVARHLQVERSQIERGT